MRLPLTCLLLTLLALPARAQEQPPEQPEPVPQGKLTLTLDPGRHTGTIMRVFFSADGKQLTTLAQDGAIRIWDIESGETVKVIYPAGLVKAASAVMSRDGTRLAVASLYPEDGKEVAVVYVLSLPDGRLERVLRWNGAPLAISPDGKRLATSSAGIRLWDLTRGDPPDLVLKGKVITGLAFSPDGQRLAWAGKGGAILDLKSGQETGSVQGGPLVAWSPDGKTIVTATGLGSDVRFHDDEGKLLHSGKHPGFGFDLRISPDSKTALVVGRNGFNAHVATLLDAANGKELISFKPSIHGSVGGAFSADGKHAATVGGADVNEIFLWQPSDGKIVKRIHSSAWITGGAANIQGAWSKDGQAVCWKSPANPKLKGLLFGRATFHLGELEFVQTLTQEQRHVPVLEKDGLMEKDGLLLKRLSPKGIEVIKDGKSVRKFGGEAAALVGSGNLALRRNQSVTVANSLTGREGLPTPDYRYMMNVNVATQRLTISRPEQAKPLLTLYRKGQDWIIWTEEGYYAATPGGERLMGWKVDNGIDKMPSFYPAERFRKQLHRPDVIKKAFELGSVAAALKALDGDKAKPADVEQSLPPKATIKVVKDAGGQVTVQVSAEAQVKSQPVVALRLLLDGRPLPEGAGFKEFDPAQAKVTTEFTLTLPPGRHALSVLARSEDASALSEAVTIGQVVAAQQPVLHLLAIGINDYQNGIPRLNCAVNDARDLAKAFPLVKQGGLFRDVKTHTLLDREATAPAIRDKLKELRPQLKNEDVLVVFFAGHGVKEGKDFFLLTAEADAAQLAKTALSGSELSRELRELRCQVLLLLDACHSGAVVKNLRNATDDAARALADDEVGVTVLAAAMGHQKALEKDGNGYFTAAIKAALAGEGRLQFNERDGRMYVRHLYTYVADVVANRSEERQHPFLSLPSTAAPVALRQFGKK